jgi:hypothetical protein
MDFELSSDQQTVRDSVSTICEQFTDDNWLQRAITTDA